MVVDSRCLDNAWKIITIVVRRGRGEGDGEDINILQ